MHRKILIAALSGATVLTVGAASFFLVDARKTSTPGPALWLSFDAPTPPDWIARVTPVAGDGLDGGVDGAGPASRFSDPFGAAVDFHGNVFVTDGGDGNRIRRIGPDGRVATFAGTRAGFIDGPAASAAFDTPSALAIDRLGNLYIADTGNNAIRKVAPDGRVSTLAGGGAPGYLDGIGRAARFDGPVGVAVDRDGNVYVADTYNDRIRRIGRDGVVTTVAGHGRSGAPGPGSLDGLGTAAGFDTPSAIAVGKDGVLFVADTGNDAIRRIDKTGAVTTLTPPVGADGHALLHRPVALALTHDGTLYVDGAGGRIVQIDPHGPYHALMDADRPPQTSFGSDGSVRLYAPRGIAVRRDGSLVVADGAALRVFALAPPRPGVPARQLAALALPAPLPAAAARAMPWPVGPQLEAHEIVGVMGEVRQLRRREPRPLPCRPGYPRRHRHARAGDLAGDGQRSVSELGLRRARRRHEPGGPVVHSHARRPRQHRQGARSALPAAIEPARQLGARAGAARRPLRRRRRARHDQPDGARAHGVPPRRHPGQPADAGIRRPERHGRAAH